MSTHDDIHDLIPDYAAGRLDSTAQSQVEVHLRDCEACRLWLEECRMAHEELAQLAAAELRAHPGPERFAQFVSGALAEGDRKHFQLHLDLCSDCAETLESIRRLEREVEYEDAPAVTAQGRRQRAVAREGARRWYARPAVTYAIAFAMLVLVAVPVMRGIWTSGPSPMEGEREQVVRLSEQTRSALSRPMIQMNPALETLILEMRFRPESDRVHSVTLATDEGRLIKGEPLSPVQAQQGIASLRIESRQLGDGDYTAVLTSISKQGDTLRVYYPFTIKRRQ